ncbi:hypothetical protein ACOBV8_19590 (plasmid) [Pseudoalteromonas espejiana]
MPEGNRYLSYSELADKLIAYTLEMGFTHIQLMPISEYPFDVSFGVISLWDYLRLRRFGDYASFKYFIEQCHKANLGVLLGLGAWALS